MLVEIATAAAKGRDDEGLILDIVKDLRRRENRARQAVAAIREALVDTERALGEGKDCYGVYQPKAEDVDRLRIALAERDMLIADLRRRGVLPDEG